MHSGKPVKKVSFFFVKKTKIRNGDLATLFGTEEGEKNAKNGDFRLFFSRPFRGVYQALLTTKADLAW